MEKIHLLDNIDASHDLLSIPDTLLKILDAVSDEDASSDRLASIILNDPSLTAKVLKMANSSYYSRSTQIKTVQQGVRVLGANALKCIALSVSIFTAPKKDDSGETEMLRRFYFHSLGVALLSRAIALRVKGVNAEEVFIAGLLHDLGCLSILHRYPKQYLEIEALVDNGEDVIEVERRYFDLDHAELGSVIANRWRLAESLQRAIRCHHEQPSDRDLDTLVRIVSLADILTMNIQTPNLKAIERHAQTVTTLAESLKLDRGFLDSFAFEILDETIEAAVHIGIDIGETTHLLNRANRELCNAYLMIEGLFRERQELSGKLLAEERLAGMIRSKNIAIATLSHYLNNVATAISGRVQLLQMALQKKELVDSSGKTSASLKVIETSLLKLLAVLAELKSVSRFEEQNFYNDSDAINIDERIKERMQTIEQNEVHI